MKWKILYTFIILMIMSKTTLGKNLIVPVDATSTELIALTNKYRVKNGLPPLKEDTTLSPYSMQRARYIADTGSFNHAGFAITSRAENLARYFKTNKEVFNAWVKSPTHKANLVNPKYTGIGIGYATDKNGKSIIVQQFR